MARLNEPAAPVESIDALKRRFIRQNREIARVNSTQSLRIRNLEAEISRLLAENIALREQAINSAQEAERLRSSQRIFKDVSRLKEQLESKLSEVSSLVTELGGLPEKAKRRLSQHQRRKSGLVDIVKSPDQKDWKNRPTIGGVAGERQVQEGRLPVIVEGKHYPRKTLESLEISRLVDGDTAASESPEIGPPPVAHFDVAEPIDYAPASTRESGFVHKGESAQDGEDDFQPLPDNLERRRKRRASALLEDMQALNTSSANVSDTNDNHVPVKTGAKRKLDVRHDAYREQPRPSELDDFSFQRKATIADTPQMRPKSSRFTKAGITPAGGSTSSKEPTTKLEPAARKVLAPKSTNSPSKSRSTGVSDKLGSLKDESGDRAKPQKPGEKKVNRTVDPFPHISPPAVENIVLSQEPDSAELPPKTPAGLDLFSPGSTEPSARAEQPTEIALTASVEDVLGGTDGRESRRARSAVSYAEPSLRAKMRRPTKELVAAVGEQTNGFKTLERESSVRAESQERQASEDSSIAKMKIMTIKRENPSDDEALAWKGLAQAAEDEPPSPLVNKVGKPSSKKEKERERETLPTTTADPRTQDVPTHQIEAALENLSIFDGPESSPHDPQPDTDSIPTVHSRKSSSSRRLSSQPVGLRRVGQEFEKAVVDRPSSKTNAAITSNDRNPPRPSSAASLRRDRDNNINSNSARNGNEKVDTLKKSASVSTLKARDATGTGGEGESNAGGVLAAGRSERAAARRRSLMI